MPHDSHPGGVPFFPHYVLKETVMVMVFLAVVFFIIAFMPTLFLPEDTNLPANPFKTPEHIKPEWYFLAPYQMLKLIPNKFVGISLQLIIVGLFLVWPLLDTSRGEHPEAAGSAHGVRDRSQPLAGADGMGQILMRGLWATLLFFILALPAAAADNVCIVCHSSDAMKPEFRKVYQEWKESWHAQNNVSCNDCHGGDPKDGANAMSPQRGFLGKPQAAAVPEFCGKCHIGILKDYVESGHGKALLAKGTGPNCVTCHQAHDVQKGAAGHHQRDALQQVPLTNGPNS